MSRAEEELHTKMVKELINVFNEKGYTIIQADLSEYPTPSKINESVPDIIARSSNGKIIIAEVETCETISLKHTKKQWNDFTNVSDGEFHVCVPKKCSEQAIINADRWGIRVNKWWNYQQ